MSFKDAVMTGMAPDGGLVLPESIPQVHGRLQSWQTLSYQDLACEILQLYTDIPRDTLKDLVDRSYAAFDSAEVTPVRKVGAFYLLELFHGPTLAFKDIALQLLGNLFEMILAERGGCLNILAATSGDTGSAAIQGVRGHTGVRIFVMHPDGRISPRQRQQMTSVLDENVFNIAIEGTFDDCQGIMKTIFRDLAFKSEYSLGSVNSINWARVLAQVVYYFYGAFRVMELTGRPQVRFAVPTGNFGDILAGYLASRMGLPVGKLILATNENDILARFFTSGDYSIGKVEATLSPSMDIQVASNFERYLYYRTGENPERLVELMEQFSQSRSLQVEVRPGQEVDRLFAAGIGNKEETLETIRNIHETHDVLLDPHTAVGVAVGLRNTSTDEPLICLATAHPAKFSAAIEQATGQDLAHHPVLDALEGSPTRCEKLPASVDRIQAFIKKRVRQEAP